jgi:hypothetical protein
MVRGGGVRGEEREKGVGEGIEKRQCGEETGYVRRGLIGEIVGPDDHGADGDACANSKIRETDDNEM